MLRGFKRGVLIVLTAFLVLSPVLVTLTPNMAMAAQDNPLDQLERWLYYRGMRACLDKPTFGSGVIEGNNEDISADDINAGRLQINNNKKGFGYLALGLDGANDSDGTVNCDDGSIFTNGAKIFGFSSVMSLVCAMNRNLPSDVNDHIEPSNPIDCEKSKKVHFVGGYSSFQPALTKALETEGSKDRPSFDLIDNNKPGVYTSKALYYLLGKMSLEQFCGGGASIESASVDNKSYEGNDRIVSVDIIDSTDGKVKSSQSYPLDSDRDENSKVDDVYYKLGSSDNNADDITCADMAKLTRENSAAYSDWARLHLSELQQIESGTQSGSDNPGGTPVEETTCAIDGIGWLVCPVMNFIGKMNDAAFGFLKNILGIRPGIITSESTQTAWAAFRDIANVAFVIAFMVIVYSQITSAGISNYGVKKMLPRIVIAAILVNVSYVICALAVDISNIVGASVYTLLTDSIAPSVGGEVSNTQWEDSISSILSAAATGIGVILLVVALFMAPAVLIAFALIILILVARQALVVLLIVIAPLAFVAYLLPNTEDWYKKWQKTFVTLLMVYPIVGIVFGASTLASQVLMSVASNENEELMKLVALGVLAVPLFTVPTLLKGSLAAAGSIGAKLSGLADKAQGAGSRQFKANVDDGKNRWNMAAANGKLGSKRFTPGGITQNRMKRDFLRSSRAAEAKRAEGVYTTGLLTGNSKEALKLQRAAGGGVARAPGASVRAGALATQQTHKQFDEDVAAHKTTMSGKSHSELMQDMTDTNLSVERRAAAAGTIMARDYREGHLEALNAAGQLAQTGDAQISDIQKQMAHDMKDKPFALGDQAAGKLVEGKYDGNLKSELQDRVGKKVSVATLAKMNPDELKSIHKLVRTGQIAAGSPEHANLLQAISDLQVDPQFKGMIKPEAATLYAELKSGTYAPGAGGTGSAHYDDSRVF